MARRRLDYAARLARLKTTYTPSFRATKRFSPQQKSAITRKWRDAQIRGRAAQLYARGFRITPPEVKPTIGRGPRIFPKRFRDLPRPRRRFPVKKKPGRVQKAKVRDTTFWKILGQPQIKALNAVMSASARGQIVRIIRRVPKSKNYPNGLASSEWWDFIGNTEDEIIAGLGALGEVAYIAAADSISIRPGAVIHHT